MTAIPSVEAEAAPVSRVARAQADLAAGLARVRRRAGLVPTHRWLAIVGGVLMPLGAVLVLIGWYGVAHTTLPWEQMSYLVSGGVFGLVLVIVGAGFYFGYWLTRMVSGERQVLEVLLRIRDRLEAVEVTPIAAVGAPGGAGAAASAGALVATKGGTLFHRPDCQVVVGRLPGELRAVNLPAPRMSACKLCNPLDEG